MRSMATDPQGNVYSVGLFNTPADFDPGPGVFMMTPQGPFDEAIFITKLDANGNFLWAGQLPLNIEGLIEMEVDKYGNVYVTSRLRDPADMDPGPGVHIIEPVAAIDAFVLKLNTNGGFVWVKQFSGASWDTHVSGTAIGVDEEGNVLICGDFGGTIDFDPGPGVFHMTGSGSPGFVVKLTADGDFMWAGKFSGGAIAIRDVKPDLQGNVYATGYFGGSPDFDPGSGEFRMSSNIDNSAFVCKLDKDGNFEWAIRPGDHNACYSIDIDEQGNLYVAGDFSGTQDFDPGPNEYHLTGNGGFILKLSSAGNLIWARKVENMSSGILYDVVADNAGNVYAIGDFYVANGPNPFTPGPTIVRFDEDGNFISTVSFAGGDVSFGRLGIDEQKNLYLGASLFNDPNVSPDPGESVHVFENGQGLIVVKMSKCPNITASTLIISSCDSYTLNQRTYDASGIYKQTIRNTAGCDSIITLDLTINRKFSEETKIICEGGSYVIGGVERSISGDYADTLSTYLGCDSILTVHLVVNPKPLPELGSERPLCANASLEITPGSFVSYIWQDMSTQPSLTVSAPGKYWVTVRNSYDCAASDTLAISGILPGPVDFLKSTDTVCRNSHLEIQPLRDFNQYQWSNGSASKTTTITLPGEYRLQVTDENGCLGADTIKIAEKECSWGVFIPTAFTPNGDGKNELFIAAVRAELEQFRLQVFDRRGRIVFETTDPRKGWDGSLNGLRLPTDAFVWQCFYKVKNEESRFQKGTVILIR